MKRTILALAAALATLNAMPAVAATQVFTTTGTFTDGATFSGTFGFDDTTKIFSDINVNTTEGVLLPFTYTSANSSGYYGAGAGPNNFIFFTNTGSRYFNFSFSSPLSSAGGTQALLASSSYECNNCSPYRFVASGSVTAGAPVAPVPEPAAWAMMLVGFGAVGVSLRRRPGEKKGALTVRFAV